MADYRSVLKMIHGEIWPALKYALPEYWNNAFKHVMEQKPDYAHEIAKTIDYTVDKNPWFAAYLQRKYFEGKLKPKRVGQTFKGKPREDFENRLRYINANPDTYLEDIKTIFLEPQLFFCELPERSVPIWRDSQKFIERERALNAFDQKPLFPENEQKLSAALKWLKAKALVSHAKHEYLIKPSKTTYQKEDEAWTSLFKADEPHLTSVIFEKRFDRQIIELYNTRGWDAEMEKAERLNAQPKLERYPF